MEKHCKTGSAKEVQDFMDKRSDNVLDDIKDFSIRLTSVHKSFKTGEQGCRGKKYCGS